MTLSGICRGLINSIWLLSTPSSVKHSNMDTVGSAEAQKLKAPPAAPKKLVHNKKITVLLVLAAIMCFDLGVIGWRECKLMYDETNPEERYSKYTYYLIKMDTYVFAIRPSHLWVLRICPFIVGALIIVAAFSRRLYRPYVGVGVSLSILALVALIRILAKDSSMMFAIVEANAIWDVARQKLFAWTLLIVDTILFLSAAMVITLGHKIRAIAPFVEK